MTPQSAVRWRDVFDFFLAQRLGFPLHAAVPPLAMESDTERAMGPDVSWPSDSFGLQTQPQDDAHGTFITAHGYAATLDNYVEHRRDITVSSLEPMCQSFRCGEGKVCTFRD